MAAPADAYVTKLASYEMPFIYLAAWLRRRRSFTALPATSSCRGIL
jgi:hypothetical protein